VRDPAPGYRRIRHHVTGESTCLRDGRYLFLGCRYRTRRTLTGGSGRRRAKTVLHGPDGYLRPSVEAEFTEDALHVALGRTL